MNAAPSPEPPLTSATVRGLIVDWGGVLTSDLRTSVERWVQADGVDVAAYSAVMGEWLGPAAAAEAWINPIHALERGEMTVPDFERHLAGALSQRSGRHHEAEGLLARMFTWFEHAPEMNALVRRARQAGIATGLLSNSWGNAYPRDLWTEMFDVVVISGEVGMRKPEPEIFWHTLDLIGLQANECVFVDDMAHNVEAAVHLGFVGIRHESYQATALELETVFGVPLA